MYKKIIAAILCTAAAVGFAPAANADIIWEPSKKDRFFHDHYDEMVNASQRSYNITKDTDIYEDPDGKIVGTVKADSEQVICYKYTDKHGVLWGGFYDTEDYDNILWIDLDDFEVIYDHISFNEEHADEIYPYDNSYSALDSDEPVTLYEYPDSEKSSIMEKHPRDWTSYIQALYKDETSVWGYISYMWGEKGWVILENISVTEAAGQSTTAKTEQDITENQYTTVSGERNVLAHPEQEAAVQTEQSTTEVSEQDTTTQDTAATPEQDTAAAIEAISETPTAAEAQPADKPDKNENSFVPAVILAAAAAGISAVLLIIFGKKKK